VRLVALAVAVLALGSHAASIPKAAYLRDSTAFVDRRIVARHVSGAVRWSGDGKLLSVGGRIVGGPRLSTGFELAWAPTGETAAYVTKHGGVMLWTPKGGLRRILADGWGASTLAWGPDGRLAIGRAVCRGACGKPSHTEIWIWQSGSPRRLLGPLADDTSPQPFAWTGGRVLWWAWPDSASVAADGVALYANGDRVAAKVLRYPDYVAACGMHLAVAAGFDRYAMHGKRILFDGRDVSRDHSRSWVSPYCTADGRLVAAASQNTTPSRIGKEHRAIWQLLPTRRQLTHPPRGRTDEFPRLLPDGSIVFVRTRTVSNPLELYGVGTIELLRSGRLTALGTASKADNYYGHYDWPDLIAVAPTG
jgi:hypothetical protein